MVGDAGGVVGEGVGLVAEVEAHAGPGAGDVGAAFPGGELAEVVVQPAFAD